MGFTGMRSSDLGDMNEPWILEKTLKVSAEFYVNALMYVVFLEKDFTAFTRFPEGPYPTPPNIKQ